MAMFLIVDMASITAHVLASKTVPTNKQNWVRCYFLVDLERVSGTKSLKGKR